MTFLPIQLPPGIVRGANPDDAPGRWNDGSLIRWREGVMEPVGGWSRITSAPLGSLCRRIHQWRRNNGNAMTLLGSDEHLYTDNSGTFVDVAPSDLVNLNSAGVEGGYGAVTYGTGDYGTARSGTTTLTPNRPAWTFSNWGEDVITVASTDGRLLYYDASSVSTDAAVVGVYNVSTISRTSNVTTIVTDTPHNLTSGDTIAVSGVTDNSFDTTLATVTVTDGTTFTYPNTGSDGSSSSGQVRDLSVPNNNRAVIVTPERHVVVLQPDGNPRRIAFSSREDFTDWNFASTTNTAGFIDVQSETQLFALEAVREGTLIWSESRAYLMRYIGQPFIYGVDELGSTRLYAPNAFAQFDGRCVWMDSSGFMLYEGGSMKSLPCPLSDYIFSNIDLLYGPRVSHAAINGKFDEVWFFYPSIGSQECNRYVVWNFSENHWSMGTLARTAAIGAGVSQYPVMTGTDKHLYQHEDGWTYDGFQCADNVFISSGTINLPGGENSLHITQLVPSNGGNYDLTKYTLYTRMTPNGAERQFGPYFSRADGYVDTRAVGRDVRIRICANDAGDWSIGRIRMKVASGGRR
jgi:hypothetical protein